MNEEYELAGVIGTEKFPQIMQYFSNGQHQSHQTDERIAPILFKNLPVGTQLFIKKVKE